MTSVDTVLRILASEYLNSKQEQIQRFLLDQEVLNKRFGEYTVTGKDEASDSDSDDDDDDDDDSDTASVFTQRMSVYKCRPHTAIGWSELEPKPDHDDSGSTKCHLSDSGDDDWTSAVAGTSTHAQEAQVHQQQVSTKISTRQGPVFTRRDTNHKLTPSSGKTLQKPVAPPGVGYDRYTRIPGGIPNHPPQDKPPAQSSRLLNRRTTRPRTATGVPITKPMLNGDKENSKTDDTEQHGPSKLIRASAPATLSRVRRLGPDPSSAFLPNTSKSSLIQSSTGASYTGASPKHHPPGTGPPYTGGSPKHHPSGTGIPYTGGSPKHHPPPVLGVTRPIQGLSYNQQSVDPTNCMLISSLNQHNTKEPLKQSDALDTSLGDSRGVNRHLTLFKLPSLDNKGRPTSRAANIASASGDNSIQRKSHFLAG